MTHLNNNEKDMILTDILLPEYQLNFLVESGLKLGEFVRKKIDWEMEVK